MTNTQKVLLSITISGILLYFILKSKKKDGGDILSSSWKRDPNQPIGSFYNPYETYGVSKYIYPPVGNISYDESKDTKYDGYYIYNHNLDGQTVKNPRITFSEKDVLRENPSEDSPIIKSFEIGDTANLINGIGVPNNYRKLASNAQSTNYWHLIQYDGDKLGWISSSNNYDYTDY